MLSDGFYAVPPGKVATIVTDLEMLTPAALTGADLPPEISFQPIEPDIETYRDIYRRVGEDWLWGDRLKMSGKALETIIFDPLVNLYTLIQDGSTEALLELDFRTNGACELAFFGLTPRLIGKGAGKALMREAIRLAWARDISRFWVHTCTLDSPQALGFYRRCGFVPVTQRVEVADDPRALGIHAPEKGAHVPYFPPIK